MVHVASGFVDLEGDTGGVSNIVRQIATRVGAQGFAARVVCGDRDLGRVVARERGCRVVQGVVVEVLAQRRHPSLGPTATLRRAIQGLPLDSVLHVHAGFSAMTEAAMAAARSRGIPFVFSPHGKLSQPGGGSPWSAKGLWWRLVAGRLVRGADAVVTSSPREASWLTGLRGTRRVVPNGYSRERPDPSPVGPSGEPYVLFLGHLDPRKQPGLLIEAFGASALRETHVLVLAGPDSYGQRGRLEARTRALGLSGRVVFTGPVSGGRKWALLSGARCLCLPSLSEGQPLVLAEALGAGLPSVYSEGCNFPEIAEAGAGLELRGFDRAAWARALETACLDESAAGAMRQAAQRLAPDYTWDRIVGCWGSLYRDVLRREPHPSGGS